MARQESRRIFAEQSDPSIQKSGEQGLSDIFFVGYEESNTGFKDALHYFLEGELTKMVMAMNGFLDEMFKGNLEHWKQSLSFMNAFTQCALNYLRFTRPVEKFFRKNLKDQLEQIEQKERTTDDIWTVQESPYVSSKSSGEKK